MLFIQANNQVAQREASLIVLPPIILGYDEFYDEGSKGNPSKEREKSSQEENYFASSNKNNNHSSDKHSHIHEGHKHDDQHDIHKHQSHEGNVHNIQDHHHNEDDIKNYNGYSHDSHEKHDVHIPGSKESGNGNVRELSHKLTHKVKYRAGNGKLNGKSCPYKSKV